MADSLHSLEELLDLSAAVLWAFGSDGVCTFARGGGLRGLGYTSAEVTGRNLLQSYPEDTEPGQLIRRTLAGEKTTSDFERADGVFVQTTYRPVIDDTGAIIGGLAFTVDVSHRREREQEDHRGAVLAGISRDLAEQATNGPQALAQAVVETVARLVGDTVLMVSLDTAGGFTGPFALAGRDEAVVEAVREALPLWRTVMGWSVGDESFRGGLPVVLDSVPPELLALMHERLTPELIEALDIGGLMAIPTRQAGEVNGQITVLRRPSSPPLKDFERELLEELGERVGLALSNAHLLDTAQRLMADRRTLLGHLIDAEELERRRIAHDIHDDTIQVMAAVDLRLQLLRRKLAAKPGMEAELEVLDSLRESTQAATSRLRRLLFELQPPALEAGGVGNALRQLADDLFVGADATWSVVDRLVTQPDQATASVLFRVGKEAVANARKHSKATQVEIMLDNHVGGFRLTVSDNGVGLPQDAAVGDIWPHLGLETMRDRTRVAGGTFAVQSRRSGGTTLVAWLPSVRPTP